MKLLICSDIHGDAVATERILQIFESEKADRIVLLGDILYHGPRNDLPEGYAPKNVIKMLNSLSEKIIAVRGNCEADVDGMVLDFPITSELSYIMDKDITLLLTHGHKFTPDDPPKMARATVMLAGHTHVPKIRELDGGCFYVNPGSVSLPKEGNPKTYAVYEDGLLSIKTLEGELFLEKRFL